MIIKEALHRLPSFRRRRSNSPLQEAQRSQTLSHTAENQPNAVVALGIAALMIYPTFLHGRIEGQVSQFLSRFQKPSIEMQKIPQQPPVMVDTTYPEFVEMAHITISKRG